MNKKSGYNKQPKQRAIRGRRDAYVTRLKRIVSADLADELQATSDATGIGLQRVVAQCLREGHALLLEEEYKGLIKLNERIGKVVHERDLREDIPGSQGGAVIETREEAPASNPNGYGDDDIGSRHPAQTGESANLDTGRREASEVIQPEVFEQSAPGEIPAIDDSLPI